MVADQRRLAVRVVILDESGAVLLFRRSESALEQPGPWWFMPGGGLKQGESFEDAARREVREETGYEVGDLGAPVLRHDVDFRFVDSMRCAHEAYFVVRAKRFEINTDGWTDRERSYIVDHRWWTPEALRSTSHRFYPEDLIAIIDTYVPEAQT